MYVSPAQLDELRALLLIGFALTGVLYLMLMWEDAQ